MDWWLRRRQAYTLSTVWPYFFDLLMVALATLLLLFTLCLPYLPPTFVLPLLLLLQVLLLLLTLFPDPIVLEKSIKKASCKQEKLNKKITKSFSVMQKKKDKQTIRRGGTLRKEDKRCVSFLWKRIENICVVALLGYVGCGRSNIKV